MQIVIVDSKMGTAETVMMLGVVVIGGLVTIKLLPTLMQGLQLGPQPVQGAPAPVPGPVAPVGGTADPARCKSEFGGSCNKECSGGDANLCNQCTAVCAGGSSGGGGGGGGGSNDDDDDNGGGRIDFDEDSPAARKLNSKIDQCRNLTGATYKACMASYARRMSYASLVRDQAINRVRRARMAKLCNSLYGYDVRVT